VRWQRLVEARDEASAAAEMMKDAKRKASAIVQEAEQKAAEIIAAAEETVVRMVQDLVHEQAAADEKRAELSTLVQKLLREVQRIS
jgi:vacuolar-type H+-ATPase subunit H